MEKIQINQHFNPEQVRVEQIITPHEFDRYVRTIRALGRKTFLPAVIAIESIKDKRGTVLGFNIYNPYRDLYFTVTTHQVIKENIKTRPICFEITDRFKNNYITDLIAEAVDISEVANLDVTNEGVIEVLPVLRSDLTRNILEGLHIELAFNYQVTTDELNLIEQRLLSEVYGDKYEDTKDIPNDIIIKSINHIIHQVDREYIRRVLEEDHGYTRLVSRLQTLDHNQGNGKRHMDELATIIQFTYQGIQDRVDTFSQGPARIKSREQIKETLEQLLRIRGTASSLELVKYYVDAKQLDEIDDPQLRETLLYNINKEQRERTHEIREILYKQRFIDQYKENKQQAKERDNLWINQIQ